MTARTIASHAITQADALAVLRELSLVGRLAGIQDTPPWRASLISAIAAAPAGEMERFERGFESLTSAVRLALEGGKPGLDLLKQLAMPGPF